MEVQLGSFGGGLPDVGAFIISEEDYDLVTDAICGRGWLNLVADALVGKGFARFVRARIDGFNEHGCLFHRGYVVAEDRRL